MTVSYKYFLPINLKQNLKYLQLVQSFSLDASMMTCHVQEYIYEYIKLYLNITKLKSKSGDHLMKQKSEKI